MKKTIRSIAAVLLVILLLIPSFAVAESIPQVGYVQNGNVAEITVTGDGGKNVSITVKDENRYYFMSQGVTSDSGKAEFKAVLDTEKEYSYKVNIDGKVLTGKIVMDRVSVDPVPETKYANIYIKGYKGLILNESNIKIKEGENVLNFTLRILNENSISYENRNGYISSIDGQGEHDRGEGSGWMFSVNGVYPNVGAGMVTLKGGDTVKWLYTENFGKDIGGSIPQDKGVNSGHVTAETKVINKEATSKVTDKQIKDALADAEKKNNVNSITIKAETKETVIKSTVVVTKNSMTEISRANMDLRVDTSVGTISIPQKALAELASKSQGSTVEIVIEKMTVDKLTEEQNAVTEDSVVYDISIVSGDKHISYLGGQKIIIYLPYELKNGQLKEKVTVWYMNDKGQLEKVNCKYDEKTKLTSFATDHLSYYVVGYDNSISFDDVTEKDWFYKYVMYAVEKGLFTGTGENIFSPNKPMTRSMLVTVLYRLEGKLEIAKTASFTDIPSGQWYSDAVSWSVEKEIVKGITETEFKPENNITREQLSVMLYRYAASKNKVSGVAGSIDSFTDKDKVSSWAVDAIKWAVGQGIITGKSNGNLDPSGSATRAEVAAMLQRYIENVK
ncbi:MAG: S-layer homology domain-containing protein [Tissierellia bacterium]|nr:S-layer homology domain-containing protein [Tissierellia bacterium]